MAYTTLADIMDRIGESTVIQLTDDNGTGTVNEAVVAGAIADADRVIDAYLSARYRLPLDPVPDLVRSISADLTVYELSSRRENVPEAHVSRRSAALALLEKLAAGTIRFDAREANVREAVKNNTGGKTRAFTLGPTGNLENL